ncbi:hypothetical protein cce_4410 [Crocosphaera subtropica ATCC 51142]|uniref:Uncharacterized protein n=1 Tax=Crocosphaera subtropica (strain ATCC 51142 / BH68) TaxID=43989 RepID=B1WTP3_CROS5|nr:hypothetical protein cce_4410 [Crocosphaera subtropica ATCC 51142]
METITIPKGFRVTPEQFEQLASAKQIARMELTKEGELIITVESVDHSTTRRFSPYCP